MQGPRTPAMLDLMHAVCTIRPAMMNWLTIDMPPIACNRLDAHHPIIQDHRLRSKSFMSHSTMHAPTIQVIQQLHLGVHLVRDEPVHLHDARLEQEVTEHETEKVGKVTTPHQPRFPQAALGRAPLAGACRHSQSPRPCWKLPPSWASCPWSCS